MIDWLSTAAGVGATLMRAAAWVDPDAVRLRRQCGGPRGDRPGGYHLVRRVPVFQRVLRPSYRLLRPRPRPRGPAPPAPPGTRPGCSPGRRSRPAAPVDLVPVAEFGDETLPIVQSHEPMAVFTTREPCLLNHVLRHPRGGLTGWRLERGGVLTGFAVLSVLGGDARVGRVVECLLDTGDEDVWHASWPWP